MIVLNDLHQGVNRSGGTTPASAAAMKLWQKTAFADFLNTVDEDLLIAGDLFDGFLVPNSDLLSAFQALSTWLTKGHKLIAMRGNHDASNDSSKLSSFDLLGELLADSSQVSFVSEPQLFGGVYCVPHLLNQDVIDMALTKVPECTFVVLHCNVDNNFAKESDHSLNISREQLDALPAKTVYVAHEHHKRKLGKAFIGGNQWPTSVSDCLDGEDKFAYRLNEDGTITPIKVWDKSNYAEMDWRNPVKDSAAQFVRFVGTAKPGEAAEMSTAIARYRKDSEAFVITNAVRVGEDEEMATLTLNSHEAIKSFDVMEAVKKLLTEDENKILESLT